MPNSPLTPQDKVKRLTAEAVQLAADVRRLPAADGLDEITEKIRSELADAYQILLLALYRDPNRADVNDGGLSVMKTIGIFFSRYATLLWDEEHGTFVVETNPAKVNCVENHLAMLLADLKQDRPISNYLGPARRINHPPSNDDLTILEDYVDICAGSDLALQHNCPGLDIDVTPETKALLQSRRSPSDP